MSTLTFGYCLLKRATALVIAASSASPPKHCSFRLAVTSDWANAPFNPAPAASAADDSKSLRRDSVNI
jgi:hypothetical protein